MSHCSSNPVWPFFVGDSGLPCILTCLMDARWVVKFFSLLELLLVVRMEQQFLSSLHAEQEIRSSIFVTQTFKFTDETFSLWARNSRRSLLVVLMKLWNCTAVVTGKLNCGRCSRLLTASLAGDAGCYFSTDSWSEHLHSDSPKWLEIPHSIVASGQSNFLNGGSVL